MAPVAMLFSSFVAKKKKKRNGSKNIVVKLMTAVLIEDKTSDWSDGQLASTSPASKKVSTLVSSLKRSYFKQSAFPRAWLLKSFVRLL